MPKDHLVIKLSKPKPSPSKTRHVTTKTVPATTLAFKTWRKPSRDMPAEAGTKHLHHHSLPSLRRHQPTFFFSPGDPLLSHQPFSLLFTCIQTPSHATRKKKTTKNRAINITGWENSSFRVFFDSLSDLENYFQDFFFWWKSRIWNFRAFLWENYWIFFVGFDHFLLRLWRVVRVVAVNLKKLIAERLSFCGEFGVFSDETLMVSIVLRFAYVVW